VIWFMQAVEWNDAAMDAVHAACCGPV
jgi:hypothetical protein